MRKQIFMLVWVMSCVVAFAQTIQVGDTVMVNRSAQTYLTGEKPSLWVYDVPHIVSQVGSLYYPNGILLNIKGANSWLSKTDVTLLSQQSPMGEVSEPEPTPVVEPALVPVVEPEPTPVVEPVPVPVVEPEPTPVVEPAPVPVVEPEPEITPQADTVVAVPQPCQAHFQLNGNIFGLAGKDHGGLGVELIFGSRLNDYVFVGGGIGLEQLWLGLDGRSIHGMQFPVFANVKAYLPLLEKYYPHLEASAGLNLGKLDNGQSDLGRKAGLYCGLHARAGLGFDYKALSIGVGYQYGGGCSSIQKDLHHAYLKIGFVFINNK